MKKKILIVLMVIVLILWLTFTFFNRGLDELENQTFAPINISGLPDGTYHGQCDQGRWKNEVDVVIEAGVMISITSVDDMVITTDEAREGIFERIIGAQSLMVDSIAGATVTCNAYKLAVQDALQSATNR